ARVQRPRAATEPLPPRAATAAELACGQRAGPGRVPGRGRDRAPRTPRAATRALARGERDHARLPGAREGCLLGASDTRAGSSPAAAGRVALPGVRRPRARRL